MFRLNIDTNSFFKIFNLALSSIYALMALFIFAYSIYYNASLPSILLFVEGGNGLHSLHRLFLPLFFIFGLSVSTLFYLFYGFGDKLTNVYTQELMSMKQRFRWIEFAFSGTLIMVTVALLLGIHSLTTILSLVMAVLALAFLGFSNETFTRSRLSAWNLAPLLMGVSIFAYIFLVLYWSYRSLRRDPAGVSSSILYFFIFALVYYGAVTAFSLLPMIQTYDEKMYEYIYGIGSLVLRSILSLFLCWSIYQMSK